MLTGLILRRVFRAIIILVLFGWIALMGAWKKTNLTCLPHSAASYSTCSTTFERGSIESSGQH